MRSNRQSKARRGRAERAARNLDAELRRRGVDCAVGSVQGGPRPYLVVELMAPATGLPNRWDGLPVHIHWRGRKGVA